MPTIYYEFLFYKIFYTTQKKCFLGKENPDTLNLTHTMVIKR